VKDIHPELLPKVRLNNFVGAPIFLLFGLFFIYPVGLPFRPESDPLGIWLLRGSIGAGLIWAAVYTGWTSTRWCRRATRVLRECPGYPVRLSLDSNQKGALIVTARPVGEAPFAGMYTLCPFPKWDLAGLEDETATAHVDPAPKGPMVLETFRGILWPLMNTPAWPVEKKVGEQRTGNSGEGEN
jgi:hypothetical protein